jgi:Zn-dependent protease with chaperone function
VLTMPLSIYGWQLSRRFGLSTQKFGGWLVDWAKGTALSAALGLVLVEIVYLLLAITPEYWWLITAIVLLFITVLIANLAPVLLVPLFFKLTPIDRPDLVRSLEALAKRAGVRVRGVYCMNLSAKTTAANAALMGLGGTRRVVIGDTLLDNYSPAEIEVVFAHELGHHVHHDVPKMVILQSVLTLVGLYLVNLALIWGVTAFGYRGIADPATLPLLAFALGLYGVISGPISNWISRRAERAADRYALRITDDAPDFIATMIKLANQNLAVYLPPRWEEILFFDHPAIGERVAMAEQFQRREGAA